MIFVYLSDHGESPYSGRGHDSSRFLPEMAQIPFFVYFNDAAVQENPDLFSKTKKRLENNIFSTLSQLPDTILEFLGIHIHKIADGTTHTPCQIGVGNCNHKDILIRNFGAGYGSIRTRISTDNHHRDLTDDATKHNILLREFSANDIGICYHRSNSIAKALRGAALTNCLEIDMIITNNRTIITHPSIPPVGISLEKIAKIVKTQKNKRMSLWIDAKNINTLDNCKTIERELSKNLYSDIHTLVAFPSSSIEEGDDLTPCIESLNQKGFFTSYYIPTNIGSECSTSISNGHSPSESEACMKLNKILNHSIFKQWFTDISFDYRAWTAISSIPAAQHFKWNTWHIKVEDVHNLPLDRFRLVMPENTDINTR
ncbi:hypothetical protein GCM10023116_24980 [Kistimonas scapharcae]|uniref:Sulfatase N-terminal domain-containing protein n=2 Tax=Kistimonas scapharcae TaxID=1036133 RepID=A0ABP8V4N1_9GAMM